MNQCVRVGLVVEGPTDYYAVKSFVGNELSNRGFDVEFVALQPPMDNTSSKAGWGKVKSWLERFNADERIRYYIGGLFAGPLSAKKCDLFLIQMDSDILDDPAFQSAVQSCGYRLGACQTPSERASEIEDVLKVWAGYPELTQAERDLHAFIPAVESTESWCVAAFQPNATEIESIFGERLCNEFMRVLHLSEGRGVPNISECNKDPIRRKRFCEKHAVGSSRIIRASNVFRTYVDEFARRLNVRG